MQYPKLELRDRILKVAKDEFMQNGYHKSSLRRMAELCDMTTGGIYTYFHSKEEIFHAIVSHAVSKWKAHYEFFISLSGIDNFTQSPASSTIPRYNHYHFLVKFVSLYREELFMVFFKSTGTRYENFQEELLNTSLEKGRERIEALASLSGEEPQQVSDFFLRSIITFNINLIREMLQSGFSLELMLKYEKEFARFFTSGWSAMLNHG